MLKQSNPEGESLFKRGARYVSQALKGFVAPRFAGIATTIVWW